MKIDAKWTLILVALVIVCSIATGGIYVALEDKIAENDFGDGDDIDISTLLPGATDLKKIDIDIPEDGSIRDVQGAYENNELKGYLIKTDTEGAYSTISLAVAITTEGTISGIEVLSHNETEGLGDEIADEEFTNRFKDKTADSLLKLVEEDTSADDEIQGLSGATISAQAVVDGVNTAVEFYNEQLKGGN